MQRVKKKRLSSSSFKFREGKGVSHMSEKQKNLMLDFLSKHPSMALDRSVTGHGSNQLWNELATILNGCGSGAQKDGCGWRRSWKDLKRYESIKAKESMTQLATTTEMMNAAPILVLSPLQERIASLLDTSLSDVAKCVNPANTNERSQISTEPCDESQNSGEPMVSTKEANCANGRINSGSLQGNNLTADVNIAQAMQNIANAMTQRNSIEERIANVLETFLTVYAAKNGLRLA